MNTDALMRNQNDESTPTVGPNNHVRVGVAVVVTIAAIGLTAQISQFKTAMVTDMSWMKQSLSALVTRFDSLEQVRQQVDRLERYGSTAAQEISKKNSEIEARLKLIEEFGSPWCRKENDVIKKQLGDLKQTLEAHELKQANGKP